MSDDGDGEMANVSVVNVRQSKSAQRITRLQRKINGRNTAQWRSAPLAMTTMEMRSDEMMR